MVPTKVYQQGLTGGGNLGSISTSGSYIDLCNIAQGLDSYQRIGRSILVVGVQIRGVFNGGQSNLSTDESFNAIRLALIRTAGQTYPGIGSVGSAVDARVLGGSITKWVWYRDFCLRTTARDSTGYIPAIAEVAFDIPVRMMVNYSGAGSGTCISEHLWFGGVTDSTVVPNPGFTSGSCSVIYTDA